MKKQRIIYIAMLSALTGSTALTSGCASIVSGSTQELSFQSNPSDTTITIDGKIIGKTPLTFRADKKQGQAVVFSKDGYKPVTMQLTTQLDPWFWGNIVIGGFIGSTTDNMSGAINHYSPNQYFITLESDKVSRMEAPVSRTRRDQTTGFVITRHREIMADLSRGHGENIDTLANLLKIPAEKKAGEIKTISEIASKQTDAVAFAEQLTQRYLP